MTKLSIFIKNGRINDTVIFGRSKDEILKLYGSPSSWLGKPPSFGREVIDYRKSDIWFYDGDAIGFCFEDDDGGINQIQISPRNIDYLSSSLMDYEGRFKTWAQSEVADFLDHHQFAHRTTIARDGSRIMVGRNFVFLFFKKLFSPCVLMIRFASDQICEKYLRDVFTL